MKKLISLLVLFGMIISCEVEVYHPSISSMGIIETHSCIPDFYDYPVYGVSYCDEECCHNEYYDNGWICEESWCYNYYYCDWQYMGEICY